MVVTAKEISIFTGKTIRTSQGYLRKVRSKKGKEPYSLITAQEFCEVFHFDLEYFSRQFRK